MSHITYLSGKIDEFILKNNLYISYKYSKPSNLIIMETINKPKLINDLLKISLILNNVNIVVIINDIDIPKSKFEEFLKDIFGSIDELNITQEINYKYFMDSIIKQNKIIIKKIE